MMAVVNNKNRATWSGSDLQMPGSRSYTCNSCSDYSQLAIMFQYYRFSANFIKKKCFKSNFKK